MALTSISLRSQDFTYAIMHGTLPVFPKLLDKPPLTQAHYKAIAQRVHPDLQSLSSSLQGAKYSPFLEPSIMQAYQELSIVIAYKESSIGKEKQLDMLEIEYFDTLWLRVQHELISLTASSFLREISDVQKICGLVIKMFVGHYQVGLYYHFATIESLVNKTMELFKSLDLQECWEEYPELMLWAFLLTIYATTDPMKQEWFLFELAKGVRNRVVWEWKTVREILLGFFYVDRVYQEKFRAICEEVRVLNRFAAQMESA